MAGGGMGGTANAVALWPLPARSDQCVSVAGRPARTATAETLALLAYLVAHAGQLMTKETLLDAVWPKTAVSDGVLKTSVGELRKALGETAQQPRYITTVSRRGYRFLAPVTVSEPPETTRVEEPPVPAGERMQGTVPEQAPLVCTPTALVEKIRTAHTALEGERKQVTVLCADLKDSLALIRDLDPKPSSSSSTLPCRP